jgi:indolepyruvate ferredoxin oxidoreductase
MPAIHDPAALFAAEEGSLHLNGIQALVRLPLDQMRADTRRGLNNGLFISGYRGSPLGGLDQQLWAQQKLLEQHSIIFSDGINEDLAATAVWGTQMLHTVDKPKYDGVLGMWYGKAPGVDRSGDTLKHGNYTGIQRNGGVLAVAGDDPSCKSSSLPSQSESLLYHVGIPSLYPADPQDILDFGLHGYMMSRCAGLWVGLKVVTNVADGYGYAEVARERINPIIPDFEFDGKPFVPHMNLGMNVRAEALEMERTLYTARQEMARRYAYANRLNHIVVPNSSAWLGIICAGKTYRDVRQALLELGIDDEALQRYGIRLLKIGMLFPLEPNIIREFSIGLEEIFVIEEKRSFLELFTKDILYGRANAPRIVGKYDELQQPLLPFHGEFEADIIARALVRRLSQKTKIESAEAWIKRLDDVYARAQPATIARTPWYCPGCPHNASTRAPENSVVSAGIGCHTMAMWMKRNVVMGTHMGAEGAQWIGMAPFTETAHIVQNMGDGTYFHSGRLAVKYAAASGVNITFKLLFNGHVSMTGGQMAMGTLPVKDVIAELLATGVKRVIVTSDRPSKFSDVPLPGGVEVWHRDRLLEAQQLLGAITGTTVLLHDQECAAELRRARSRGEAAEPPARVVINERVCEGCGDCGAKSNCMSVEPAATEFGRKTRIHQSSCNKDYSCVKGFCPAFLSITPASSKHGMPPAKKVRRLPALEREVPEPVRKVDADFFECHIMGVGGTGTITVAQILSAAALIEGKFSYGLDQTGLAQKGGAVVSDIKISAKAYEGANKISDGYADLYLGFDVITATAAVNLAKCHPERSIAIISTAQSPTGFMVVDRTVQFPEMDNLKRSIDAVSRKADNIYLDAQRLAEGLFADSMATNMLLVGVAYQCGALPLDAGSIEAAIQQNGIQVEMSVLAFRWGRMAVVDREFVLAEIRKVKNDPIPIPVLGSAARTIVDGVGAQGETRRLLEIRVPDLIAYQNTAYAQRYADIVKQVLVAEQSAVRGSSALSEAVARYLYKLMAYKDEYEVARLQTDPAFLAALKSEFKSGYRATYHLAPPLLASRDPVTGELQKKEYGGWVLGAFGFLAKLKFLRGTPFDVFGKTAERCQERQLIVDYIDMINGICSKLNEENFSTAVKIASVPDVIRGYGHVKIAGIEAAAANQKALLREFHGLQFVELKVNLKRPRGEYRPSIASAK